MLNESDAARIFVAAIRAGCYQKVSGIGVGDSRVLQTNLLAQDYVDFLRAVDAHAEAARKEES